MYKHWEYKVKLTYIGTIVDYLAYQNFYHTIEEALRKFNYLANTIERTSERPYEDTFYFIDEDHNGFNNETEEIIVEIERLIDGEYQPIKGVIITC